MIMVHVATYVTPPLIGFSDYHPLGYTVGLIGRVSFLIHIKMNYVVVKFFLVKPALNHHLPPCDNIVLRVVVE